MTRHVALAIAGGLAFAAAALVPLLDDGFWLALAISTLNYLVLATAWALFSGPTRYVSLATAAFFGIGVYTVAAVGELLPWIAVLAIAILIGTGFAVLVGIATLRLSGVYFVIFTFGLAELVGQLVTWYEVNITNSVGRYVFLDISQREIYWQLLILVVLVFAAGWWIKRSRLGFSLRIIGDDEQVAAHLGINTAHAKILLFAMSAAFMTAVGAIMAPRWTYIDPHIAFDPIISFQVLIMALLGGADRLHGPLLGVVPVTLLFETLTIRFPNHFSILLGLAFIVIVFMIPRGVVGLFEDWRRRRGAAEKHA